MKGCTPGDYEPPGTPGANEDRVGHLSVCPEEDDTFGPADDDPFARMAHDLGERMQRHETIRASAEYLAQMTYMERLTKDFIVGMNSAALAFTRYPDGKDWLLQSSMDDLLESAISLVALGRQGVFNVGRRELRYMIETAVKCVYVDQTLPGNTPIIERIDFAGNGDRLPRSSIDVVDLLTVRMLKEPGEFVSSVHSAFGALSGYTHLSGPQLEERRRRVERGEFMGFESASTLRAFNRLLAQSYDLVLTVIFEGIGAAFTGDLFVQVFDADPDWKFHKGRYVRQISAFFDYKAERQRS